MPVIVPIDATTYKCDMSPLCEVEIGDNISPICRPHIKLKRKNGKCEQSIYFPDDPAGLVTFDSGANKLTYPIDNNTELIIYPKDPDDLNPEGAIEIDLVLKKKPAGNKNTFTFKLETTTIDYQKILPLDVEYDQAKCIDHFPKHTAPFVITPTSIAAADGEVLKTRAENLVNSYRGRAKQNYHVKSELGEIKADTPNKGKQLSYTRVSRTTAHLRRGKMVDADGVEAWVEDMNLVGDELTFTLPADFLKTAKYPIRQAVGLDPAYTEDMDSWLSTAYGGSDGVFGDYDLHANKGVPHGAVAEIILTNQEAGVENTMGVRTDGSGLARYVTLHEAEGGGVTTCRMFVLNDVTTGNIECYHSDVSDADSFYIVGYWENVGFTERFDDETPGTGGSWQADEVLVDSGAASRISHFLLRNQEDNTSNTMGVRDTSSAVERKVLIHEQETGGESILDMLTKADASYQVDIYTSDIVNTVITNAGYFGSEMDFVELFQQLAVGIGAWKTVDITAYLDQDGRTCDFLLAHNNNSSYGGLGVRDGDDTTTARELDEHEAEDNGSSTGERTGFGMTAQSNASGVIGAISSPISDSVFLMGYFKLTSGVQDYPISLSPGLTASATVAYKAAWDRSANPALTIAVSLTRKLAYKRATTTGLTVSATIAKAYGWLITTTAGLTASATVARKVAYKRAIAPGITAAVTIVKGWGRTIATTAGLTVSATVATVKGFKKALSPGLTVSSTVARKVAFKRATLPGMTVSVTVARALAFKKAVSASLTVAVSIAKAFGRTIATTTGLTVSASVVKSWGRTITTSAGLSVAVSIVASQVSGLVRTFWYYLKGSM